MPEPRFCIYIPCYNAAGFLASTVQRIPWDKLPTGYDYSVLFVDNASQDGTAKLIGEMRRDLEQRGIPTSALMHPNNRGYGGSVKAAFAYAVDHKVDYLAVVHADGQYAPEELPRLMAALVEQPRVCLLFGSRLTGKPLAGGMPFYKYAANHFLSQLQNLFTGLSLSEYHSGYRLYRMQLAGRLPFKWLSDGFVFDNEIIFAIHSWGYRIAELPIPTFYGKEKSHVPRLGTPLAILGNLTQYMLCRLGLRKDPRYQKGAVKHVKPVEQ